MIDAKRKAMIFLIIAFLLAVITSVLVLDQIRAAQESLNERTEVAVAAEDIQTYSELTEDMIEWVEIPQVDNLGSFVRDVSELEGAVSIVTLQEGDLLTSNILRTAAEIPADHRVVWLNATSNVVMDQPVAAGDTVDIVVTYSPEDSDLTTIRSFEEVDVIQREELGDEASNIKISLSIEEAERLIHFQNTADSIRVLLSNQVQQAGIQGEEPAGETQEDAAVDEAEDNDSAGEDTPEDEPAGENEAEEDEDHNENNDEENSNDDNGTDEDNDADGDE